MRKGFGFVVGILFGFMSSIYADIGRWSPLGPIYGGVVRTMVSNDFYVYAGTRGDGVFRARWRVRTGNRLAYGILLSMRWQFTGKCPVQSSSACNQTGYLSAPTVY